MLPYTVHKLQVTCFYTFKFQINRPMLKMDNVLRNNAAIGGSDDVVVEEN